jgi:hypothetical protein
MKIASLKTDDAGRAAGPGMESIISQIPTLGQSRENSRSRCILSRH